MDYFNKVKLELKFLLCLMEIKMSVYIIGYGQRMWVLCDWFMI